MLVDVQLASTLDGIPSVADFEQWAIAALGTVDAGAQLCVRIVDEAEGAQLNENYRGRKAPTNVLSFSFDAAECLEPPLLGDIIICAPVVAREAGAQGKSLNAHYAHMVVHGTLHLLGLDHKTEADARSMEAVEQGIVTRLGFDNPFAADVEP